MVTVIEEIAEGIGRFFFRFKSSCQGIAWEEYGRGKKGSVAQRNSWAG